jgi:hypothetical protein
VKFLVMCGVNAMIRVAHKCRFQNTPPHPGLTILHQQDVWSSWHGIESSISFK